MSSYCSVSGRKLSPSLYPEDKHHLLLLMDNIFSSSSSSSRPLRVWYLPLRESIISYFSSRGEHLLLQDFIIYFSFSFFRNMLSPPPPVESPSPSPSPLRPPPSRPCPLVLGSQEKVVPTIVTKALWILLKVKCSF